MSKVFVTLLVGVMLVGSTFAYAEDVYATKNGKRYHKADCLLIKDKGAKPIAMEEAQKKGLKTCRRCFGNPDGAKNVSNQAPVAAPVAPVAEGQATK
ncbi:MAG: hypothetical protein HQL15_07180 [Candidatus Omnitrophica bacterium]|nr:hypothetical protein [Candidatus Omnitrophota bacterium]